MGAVFSHLDDIWSLVQSTEVCRLWWLEGHHRVWRKIQLRDLTGYVKDLSRRQYFASFVEELAFEPDDTILADARMSIPLLDFTRLSSVKLYGSTLIGARTGNLMSLIVPSPRSWTIKESDVERKDNHYQDDITTMSALLTGAATLRSLRIDMDCNHTLGPGVYQMLDDGHVVRLPTRGAVLVLSTAVYFCFTLLYFSRTQSTVRLQYEERVLHIWLRRQLLVSSVHSLTPVLL